MSNPMQLDAPSVLHKHTRFPPFPSPPEGVSITPLAEFVPVGICVNDDPPPRHVERDGCGVPTIGLRVNHAYPNAELLKKKEMRTITDVSGNARRPTWFEEWEARESSRLTSTPVNPNVLRIDRLHQASQDFKAGRPWPSFRSGVPYLWDVFCQYIGIIGRIPISPHRKWLYMQQRAAYDDEDGGDNDGEEGEERGQVTIVDPEQAQEITEQQFAKPRPPQLAEEEQQRRVDDLRETKHRRMDAFFDDTETNIKIFFSSYYRDRGLIWSKVKARDGPILVEYFLNFLLRNNVLWEREHEKGLRRALQVVAKARTELPATFAIGRTGKEADEEANIIKAAVGHSDLEILSPEAVAVLAEEVQREHATDDANVDSRETSGRSSSRGTSTGWQTKETNNPWIPLEPNPLMATLGATILPLTQTGIVERSTRRIVAISPPKKIKPRKKAKGEDDTEQVEQEL
ncbi:hypothetical protein WOLCODRAFT_162657 [Wolfiporia cocos MD-104 SS10]|uniref:Uncharacterized protein n=1 Tax=Wolfiporia cocos (strain MD-104) TaxID=742152 RepID=A0A2H3JQ30_WOLCO|nr:hypothetical protein WOLCODRAFT_162657 [Wolfiporia cocos MD-104 SS10]